jgi:membrane-associated protease RseP (regulator of RpoE activity)
MMEMMRTTKAFTLLLIIIGFLSLSPVALAQTAKPTNTPKPSNTPKPTATPKPPFDFCTLYPSATPRKNSTPTKAPESTNEPSPTNTAVVPSATPGAVDNPTTVPNGIKPADILIQLRQSVAYQRGGKACVVVYEVAPGGPAALAGIQAGDLILGIEKTPITELADFYNELLKRVSGDVVKITLQRKGQQIAVSVTLGLNPYADPNATPIPTATATATKKK